MLELVLHPLTLRMSRRPQFEILEAVVKAVAVYVMDDLVSLEGTAEESCHDQAMFCQFRVAPGQMPFGGSYRDVSVAMADPASAIRRRHRFARPHVTGRLPPLVVGPAQALRLRGTTAGRPAVVDLAAGDLPSALERDGGLDVTVPLPALVVPVAPAAGIDRVLTGGSGTSRADRPAGRSAGVHVTVAQQSTIVQLAATPRVTGPGAEGHRAVLGLD